MAWQNIALGIILSVAPDLTLQGLELVTDFYSVINRLMVTDERKQLLTTAYQQLLTHHPGHHFLKHAGLGEFIQVVVEYFHLFHQPGLRFIVAVYFLE